MCWRQGLSGGFWELRCVCCPALAFRLRRSSLADSLWQPLYCAYIFVLRIKKSFVSTREIFGILLYWDIFAAGGLKIRPVGVLTGLLAGIGYGSYGIFAKVLTRKYHSLTITFYTFFLASVGGLIICRPKDMLHIVGESPEAVLYFLAAAVVCFVVPYILYNLALRVIEASRAAVIVAIEPVMTTVFGVLIYREWPTVEILCGMMMVLCAIIILNTGKEKSEN